MIGEIELDHLFSSFGLNKLDHQLLFLTINQSLDIFLSAVVSLLFHFFLITFIFGLRLAGLLESTSALLVEVTDPIPSVS